MTPAAERHMDELRRALEGSHIVSHGPTTVLVTVGDRAKRMNLMGILANIRERVV